MNTICKRLQYLPIWERLNPSEQAIFCNRASVVRYKAGQNIHSIDASCLGILIVESGILRTYLLSEDGRDVTIHRFKEKEICVLTASCVMDDINFNVQIDAETDCELVLLPAGMYAEIMKTNVYAESYLYKKLADIFSNVINAVEHILFLGLEQRLAMFLTEELNAIDDGDTIYFTHEQIARAIGSARESVSRSLKQLGEEGLIELFRGGIKIKDKAALLKKI